VTIHSSVSQISVQFTKEQKRFHYVTPSSYLEFLKLFLQLLKEKREYLNTEQETLVVGLKKLTSTREAVVVLQAELSELKPYLETTAAETKRLMDEIFRDQEEVDKAKVTITMEEAEIAVTTKEIQVTVQSALFL
jgi:dynein heavy chain